MESLGEHITTVLGKSLLKLSGKSRQPYLVEIVLGYSTELHMGEFEDCALGCAANLKLVHRPAAMRKGKLDMIREAFLKIKGARWIPRDSLPKDHYFFSRERISSGTPDFEELRWLNWMV